MTPQVPQQAADPTLAADKARADADRITSLQQRTEMDTAAIMSRFGAQRALAGATPVVTTPIAAVT